MVNSCSFYSPFFIQNLSQKIIELKVSYNVPVRDVDEDDKYKISYQNGILTPDQFEKLGSSEIIVRRQISDSVVTINIPANSTVKLAGTSNNEFCKSNQINLV